MKLLKKCLGSGDILNMGVTGHADKLNEGPEQARTIQDDIGLFGLKNWKDRIVIV